MSTVYIVMSVFYALLCVGLVVVILLQKKRSAGLGSMSGMGSGTATYWDKNKSRSREGQLELATKICAAVFFILPLVVSLTK